MGRGPGEGSGEVELSTRTVWLRTPFTQAPRMPQRGQSLQKTGAPGSREAVFSRAGEEAKREALSGQSTALTRRGLRVVLLS
jgi:hypothetical protein